jgi:chaperone required for assembly of F1-ATPase
VEIAAIMKRFYKDVSVAAADGGWRVLLDGRGIKTAAGKAQIVPSEALADALAAEWAGQGEELDPKAFRLRDLTDYALDIVADDREAVIRSVLRFAETDTLCYRGDAGEALWERQQQVWEPLLKAAEARWDIHFVRIEGVIHQPQPPATLERLAKVLRAHSDFSLAALNTLASLSTSLVIALAAIAPDAEAVALWDAANLEEDWQAELWGKDAEAEALRAGRFTEFSAAMGFARLAA